ncbi:MAG: tRNA nucleotidyltransferase, partial [Acutalibacteraceae bacterium]
MIVSRLAGAGYRAYAVGGCVRDSLLGRTPHDWDIATDARPEETKAVFRDLPVIETGIRHGTIT